MDVVKTIRLPSIVLTLFMHVYMDIIKKTTVPLDKTMIKASFHLFDVTLHVSVRKFCRERTEWRSFVDVLGRQA